MQNRYVGDLGDFGKFGLLRALCSCSETGNGAAMSLGVVWYLVPDENHNDDGKFVRYLEPTAKNQQLFRACDPDLYDALRSIVASGARNVTNIRGGDVLPINTRYCEAPLHFDKRSGSGIQIRRQRAELRTLWLKEAIRSTADCDMVFFDPDNGLEVKIGPHEPRGPKYAYFHELLPFAERDQSLVVYQHVTRRGSAKEQVRRRIGEVQDELGRGSFALLYHRGSARAFLVIPAPRHRTSLHSKAGEFLRTPWARHFELVGPE